MFQEGQEILEKRYKVIKKQGGGAFGEIYKGTSNIKIAKIINTLLIVEKRKTGEILAAKVVKILFVHLTT